MKKTFKFFAAALAIVAAASCAKENANVDDERQDIDLPLTEVVFDASLLKTKTTIEGLEVHWTQDDKILVFPYKKGTTNDNDSPYKGTEISIINESISEDFAKFSGSAYTSNSYAAIYPSSLVYKDNGYANRWGFVTNTLRTQTAVAGDFPKVHNVPAHISVATDGDGSTMFQFANALAYFKFQVVEDGIYEIELSAAKVSFSSMNNGSDRSLSDGANLGGTLWYRPETGKFDLRYASDNDQIVITNENKAFVTGTIYYIALPPVDMENLTLTGRNESGIDVFQYTKSSFTAESNTIYNLGSLSASGGSAPTPQDELTVSATNITIPAAGGSQTFTITTNNDWTITSTQDWITVSPTSGSAGTHTITLSAEANTTGYNRNRAYIDVKAGSLSKSVTADQSMLTVVYSRGEQVSGADAMEDGAYYVILRKGSSNDYLAANNSGQLIVSGISDVNNISKANIFVYHKDDSKKVTSTTSYGQTSGGTLQSLYNSGYIDKDMKLSNTAQDVTLGSHWGDTDPNIDIYRAVYTQNIGAFDYYQFISYVNSSISWKKGEEVSSSDLRKWYFYKVNAVSE